MMPTPVFLVRVLYLVLVLNSVTLTRVFLFCRFCRFFMPPGLVLRTEEVWLQKEMMLVACAATTD